MECPSVSSREVHAGHTHTLCHHFVKCACRAPEPPSNLPQLIPAPAPSGSCSRRDVNKQGCGSLPVPGIPQGPLRSAPGAGSSWGSLALPAPPGGVPYAPSEEAAGKKPPGGDRKSVV